MLSGFRNNSKRDICQRRACQRRQKDENWTTESHHKLDQYAGSTMVIHFASHLSGIPVFPGLSRCHVSRATGNRVLRPVVNAYHYPKRCSNNPSSTFRNQQQQITFSSAELRRLWSPYYPSNAIVDIRRRCYLLLYYRRQDPSMPARKSRMTPRSTPAPGHCWHS